MPTISFNAKLWIARLIAILMIAGGIVLFNYGNNSAQQPSHKTTPVTNNHATTHTISATTQTPVVAQTSSNAASNTPVTHKSNTTPAATTVTPTVAPTTTTTSGGNSTTTPPSNNNGSTNPNPTPAPTPTFHVTLQPDSAYQQPPFPGLPANVQQYVIPFTITMDPGFTYTNPATMDCAITSAPAGSNMLCNASQKVEGSGFLVVQYDDTTPAGDYTVELYYTFDGVTQTDAVIITLA